MVIHCILYLKQDVFNSVNLERLLNDCVICIKNVNASKKCKVKTHRNVLQYDICCCFLQSCSA